MWTYIPDEEGKAAWTGQLTSPDAPKSLWRFELIRHVDQEDLYRTKPFGDGRPVIGLLDLQERCTLVGPVVGTIDPGSVGVHTVGLRTRIVGEPPKPKEPIMESNGFKVGEHVVYDTERHLLYVACTRARDHLLVSGVNPVSGFLDDLANPEGRS